MSNKLWLQVLKTVRPLVSQASDQDLRRWLLVILVFVGACSHPELIPPVTTAALVVPGRRNR